MGTNHSYRAVPTPNPQCDTAINHLITNAVFNISSDVLMLALGIPMFVRIQIPLSKKIPLVGIFSLGIFVIVAAVLNKYYSFTSPFADAWVFWYVRESATAVIVANLPFVWLLYRRIFGIRTTSVTGSRSNPKSGANEISLRSRRETKGPVTMTSSRVGRRNSDDSDLALGPQHGRSYMCEVSTATDDTRREEASSDKASKEKSPARKKSKLPYGDRLGDIQVASEFSIDTSDKKSTGSFV